MYAVFETGGKQYKAKSGDTVYVETLGKKEGEAVVFDRILFLSDGKKPTFGKPLISGAKVTGEVVTVADPGPKLVVYKFRRRKNYRKKTGHRQKLTAVRIKDVKAQ